MAGFNSISGDESIMFADNCSFDGTQRGGKMTTDGQLWIGSTAAPHVQVGNLISNGSILITYIGPNIKIDTLQAPFFWSDQNSPFSASANNGYFIFGSCTGSLNPIAANGDTVRFFVDGAVTLTVQAGAGQKIKIATALSSSGGTVSNTMSGDALELVFRSTDNQWQAVSFVGAWNFT